MLVRERDMSIYQPIEITCNCGDTFTAQVAHGVNVDRLPEIRQEIIAGSFHTATCQSCGSETIIEKEFLYSDFARNTFFKVKPRKTRHLWQEASKELDGDLAKLPKEISVNGATHRRVVFGLGELREKLIAQDAGLDDRLVELAKVLLVYEHPFLLRQARLRLQLDRVTDDRLSFVALHDHGNDTFKIDLPRGIFDGLGEHRGEIRDWVGRSHTRANIFDLQGDHWVNMWRWSPQTTALWNLSSFSHRVRTGGDLDLDSGAFGFMLRYLPRGSHLPRWAKSALRDISNYAKAQDAPLVADQLFEIRFDMALDDEWALNNNPDDIDTLWDLLRDLPDTNVEGNTFISSLELVSGSGGWYDPRTNEIGIGSGLLWAQEAFQDVVRHEVGHAVQDKLDRSADNQVSSWLEREFGWAMFDGTNADIDAWVELMGGYGDISGAEVGQVRQMLRYCLGPGSQWSPPNIPFVPADHPWRRPDFGPRLAFQRTGARWYRNYRQWHRYDGKAFFVNFYYQRFMVVDEATLELIDRMPSNYASMSPYEFFAELYALYYDLDDPMRVDIPGHVGDWLTRHVGDPLAA